MAFSQSVLLLPACSWGVALATVRMAFGNPRNRELEQASVPLANRRTANSVEQLLRRRNGVGSHSIERCGVSAKKWACEGVRESQREGMCTTR